MEYMKETLVNSMFMEPVKEDEVTTIISNLKIQLEDMMKLQLEL